MPDDPRDDGRAETLRERLRSDTRSSHDHLDTMLGALDLATPRDLRIFLTIQHGAMIRLRACLAAAVDPAATEARRAAQLLDEMIAALRHDLGQAEECTVLDSDPLVAEAVAYVTLGSRLGTRAMAQHWGAALGRSRYFALPARGAEWRALVAALSAAPATGRAADRITEDALTCFSIFAAEAAHWMPVPAAEPA